MGHIYIYIVRFTVFQFTQVLDRHIISVFLIYQGRSLSALTVTPCYLENCFCFNMCFVIRSKPYTWLVKDV